MNRKNKSFPPAGFTLLELSIVILVLSLMLGGIMTVVNQNVRIEKQNSLQEKFDTIKEAMLTYRRRYERLPCPGDLTVEVTAANFGRESDEPTDCTDGTPPANFASASVFAGAVPTKTLGIPSEYAFDPWGNRFLYSVDGRVTDTEANAPFKTYPPNSTTIGNMKLLDNESDTISTNVLYVVVSHGPNGHGAYGVGGVRKANDSTNAHELENCDCNASAATTGFDEVFIMAPQTSSTTALNQYDDSVMAVYRTDLLSAEEEGLTNP